MAWKIMNFSMKSMECGRFHHKVLFPRKKRHSNEKGTLMQTQIIIDILRRKKFMVVYSIHEFTLFLCYLVMFRIEMRGKIHINFIAAVFYCSFGAFSSSFSFPFSCFIKKKNKKLSQLK